MPLECQNRIRVDTSSGESFEYATTILTDEARVDIAARGVWVKGQMTLFDDPIAKAYLTSNLSCISKKRIRKKESIW